MPSHYCYGPDPTAGEIMEMLSLDRFLLWTKIAADHLCEWEVASFGVTSAAKPLWSARGECNEATAFYHGQPDGSRQGHLFDLFVNPG